MHINIELNFKNKNFLILASVAVLAIVLLIMNSIYLGAIDTDIRNIENQAGSQVAQDPKTLALGAPGASVALSALAFLLVVFTLSKYFKDGSELSSSAIFALVIAFMLLSISFALNIQMLHKMWMSKNDPTFTSLDTAAVNSFPTNIAFMSACGLGFIAGTYTHFKENF